MEGLVQTELEIVRHLENYISTEEARISRLKGYLKEYERMYHEASNDVSKYLENPINAYLIVKRLTTDWKVVENAMVENAGQALVQNITQHKNVLRFPSDEDLNGAAVALMRLQDTYQLDTHALAEGILLGKKYSQHLTAGDCFELGRQSYNNGDHYHTVLWMGEALEKYENEEAKTITRQDILEYLAFSTYMQGNVREALQLTDELLELVPYHQRALGNRKYYLDMLRERGEINARGDTGSLDLKGYQPFSTGNLRLQKPSNNLPERDVYEMLCRGEKMMDPQIEKNLRCRYVTNGVAFLKLQPIKEEEAYLNPRILIYHDVITDKEIEIVKKMAQPRFKRATVQNHVTGALEPASYRISKSAWLKSEESRFVHEVSRRVGDITGLDMDTAEELQVVNYGIGGHYEPHFDHARRDEESAFESLGTGNRIATWLFYMSDVEAGGATVFPALNISLWPRKGSAVFWYNLLPNGEGNERTRHAACPVLTGSKWVSNKWIHERGQEFRRPCRLERDAEV